MLPKHVYLLASAGVKFAGCSHARSPSAMPLPFLIWSVPRSLLSLVWRKENQIRRAVGSGGGDKDLEKAGDRLQGVEISDGSTCSTAGSCSLLPDLRC